MTKRQQVFVREYLTDLNTTRAAIAAGYSKKTAASQGSRLLKNVNVAKVIAEKHGKRLEALDVSADKVLTELAKMGFANMLDYISIGEDGSFIVDFKSVDRDKAAAIHEVTVEEYMERTGEDDNGKPTFERVKRVKFKLAEKRGSLELLGRHLKLFTDKVEHSGEDGGPIPFVVKVTADELPEPKKKE